MDVNTLLLLLDVVDGGSLAAASRRTGVPKSTLSRRIGELERELGVRLLQRTPRKLGLTEAGQRLVEHARRLAETVEEARRDVRARGETAEGRLRVTMSVSFAERVLMPVLLRFMEAHPKVELELVLDPGRSDLIAEGIDVAIRIGDPDPKSPLVARRLAETVLYPVASPAYLAAHGHPETLDDLRAHRGLFYRPSRETPAFLLEGPAGEVRRVTPSARLLVNSHILVREAAIRGMGVACLAAVHAAEPLEDGRLVRILPAWRSPKKWVYAAFPSRDLSGAARAFVDWVAAHLGGDQFLP